MKIDFYVLQQPDIKSYQDLICRLAEKAYKNRNNIYIHTNNQKEAHQLDELLWTYRDDSFLPHNLVNEGPDQTPPIQIGFAEKPENHRDILLNLHQSVPEFYLNFSRILEVVAADAESQAMAREHYRFYRAAGYEITTHKI